MPRTEGSTNSCNLSVSSPERSCNDESAVREPQRDAGFALCGVHRAESKRKPDVFGSGQHRDQPEGLEHERQLVAAQGCAGAFVQLRDIRSIDQDAAVRRLVQTPDTVEQRGLARPRPPDECDECTGRHGERDVPQGSQSRDYPPLTKARAADMTSRYLSAASASAGASSSSCGFIPMNHARTV
jgi:hypothetical protein